MLQYHPPVLSEELVVLLSINRTCTDLIFDGNSRLCCTSSDNCTRCTDSPADLTLVAGCVTCQIVGYAKLYSDDREGDKSAKLC